MWGFFTHWLLCPVCFHYGEDETKVVIRYSKDHKYGMHAFIQHVVKGGAHRLKWERKKQQHIIITPVYMHQTVLLAKMCMGLHYSRSAF